MTPRPLVLLGTLALLATVEGCQLAHAHLGGGDDAPSPDVVTRDAPDAIEPVDAIDAIDVADAQDAPPAMDAADVVDAVEPSPEPALESGVDVPVAMDVPVDMPVAMDVPVDVPAMDIPVAADAGPHAGDPCSPGMAAVCPAGSACFAYAPLGGGAMVHYCQSCGAAGERECPAGSGMPPCASGAMMAMSPFTTCVVSMMDHAPGGTCSGPTDVTCHPMAQCTSVSTTSFACLLCGTRGQACCLGAGWPTPCTDGSHCVETSNWSVCAAP